ncbi:MAG: DUF3488 and transglutaminase-like domain-containing protein [Nitrospira sp.]|nr:DUF3488 and transglutaminase-like domain-containing protein [Nitrospira sp.]
MSSDQTLRFLSILLTSVSFVGLVLGASLPEWVTVLAGGSLIIALLRTSGVPVIHRLTASIEISTTTWNILVLLGFTIFWIDAVWISGDLLRAGVHFLLILMVIKLGNLQRHRDYRHLYGISLVAVLAAASLTTDLWYFPVFIAYLLVGVWTLLFFQMTKQPECTETSWGVVQPMQEEPDQGGGVTPQLFWMANGLAAATFGFTVVIFFAIPRVGAGFYQKGFGENIRTSGFSNTVDLGAIGPIKRNPSVVMRVELPDSSGRDARQLYLRGSVFDQYNGKTWVNLLDHRRAVAENGHGTFAVHRSSSQRTSFVGSPLRQKILLEPLDTPVLFAAPFAETIIGKLPAIQADFVDGLYLPSPGSARIEYSVISRPHPVLPADLQPTPVSYPEPFLRHFLQLPGHPDRITTLTQEVIRDKQSTYEKAIAVQNHLLQGYRYSLDAPLAEQNDPLEEFLFNRKTGYCEHYATAMVVMLRTQGIPARLITGFLATEWNEYGNYFVVRQQDAHAWVEVHLPHSGWVMMDPTPALGESVAPASPTWQTLGSILDSVRLRWNRLFVQYSTADQLAMARGIQVGSVAVKNKAKESLAYMVDSMTAVMGRATRYFNDNHLMWVSESFLALIAVTFLIWLNWAKVWGRGGHSKNVRSEDHEVTHLYKRMVVHLEKKGILKPVGMTPLEFIRIMQEEWAEARLPVSTITELYCKGRFGKHPVTQEEYRSAQETFRQLLALERH